MKRGRGFKFGDYREQIQLAVRAGLELGASELQVQRSNRSATLPLLEHHENIKVL